MSALQRLLDRMPDDAHRQSFLRLVAEAGIKEDSPDMVFLALDHEARWAAVQAMQEQRAVLEALTRDLPTRLASVLRAQTEQISKSIEDNVGRSVARSLRDHIGDQFRAQHAVALEAHQVAHRAIANLEDRASAHIRQLSTKTQSVLTARYLLVIWSLVIALLFSLYNGAWTGYRLGYSRAWSVATGAQARLDARTYLHDPATFRAEAKRTR